MSIGLSTSKRLRATHTRTKARTPFVLASTGAHNGRAFSDSAVASSSVHGGQQASAPCRSICCPQVGAPNFREFAWEGDGTVLDCVLCVKLAKQHISLTRSVRSQPCQWDVVMNR